MTNYANSSAAIRRLVEGMVDPCCPICYQFHHRNPQNMHDSWSRKSKKYIRWPKYTHHTSSAEDSSWCPFVLHPTSVQCKHQPLQRSESVLTCFHNTTVVHKISSCSPRIAWLRSLWGAWNVINPDSARLTEVFLLLNRGTLNRGIQGVRKNEKMQGWGRF